MDLLNKKIEVRHIMTVILLIVVFFMIWNSIKGYKILPIEASQLGETNLIEDGSFENFNHTVGDCCNANPNKSRVFASKSAEAYEGSYSLNLTSESQCACIGKSVSHFENDSTYLVSFRYKGPSALLCASALGDNKCLIREGQEPSQTWRLYRKIINPTGKTKALDIVLYSNTDGTKSVTNLYDSLEVQKMTPIPPEGPFEMNRSYIIKTKIGNLVNGEKITEINEDNNLEYIIQGKPSITLKFPALEVGMIIGILLIIYRLLFSKKDKV